MTETAIDIRRQAAEARLRVIRNALEVADEELERAFVERDWEALRFDSWEAYCAAIPEFQHFTMKVGPRRERVRRLRAAGANIPQVKAATGSSLGTVHRDLQVLEGGHSREPAFQVETEPPLPPDIIEAMTAWQVVLRHVAHAGATGLTCLEFEGETGRGHGAASAAFHSAERKGYVRRDGRFRGSYAVYVATSG